MHWTRLPEEHKKKIVPKIHPNLLQDNVFAYVWRAHVWPGVRLWYDGTVYVLPAEVPDVPWFVPMDEKEKQLLRHG